MNTARAEMSGLLLSQAPDDVGRIVCGDQELKVLKEINELLDFENDNWSRGSV